MNVIEGEEFREKIGYELIASGNHLREVSSRQYSPNWLNIGLTAALSFGNLGLFYAGLKLQEHHQQLVEFAQRTGDLALASKAGQLRNFDNRILNSIVNSIPVEMITFTQVLKHQSDKYKGKNIPLSTHILPGIANFSIWLGRKILPKHKFDPSQW